MNQAQRSRTEYMVGQIVEFTYDPKDTVFCAIGFMEKGFMFQFRIPQTDENMQYIERAFSENKKDVWIQVNEISIITAMAFLEIEDEDEEDDK